MRARGLKPGESERRLEPEEVKEISGKVRVSQALLDKRHYRGPFHEALDVDVYAHPDFLVAETRVLSDGSFRVHGLPPGTYVVSVNLFHGDRGDDPRWNRVEAGTTDLVIDFD